MAFPDLNPHEFAGAGNMKPTLRPLMSLDFWHAKLPLFPVLF